MVVALGEHVDYWSWLGWKAVFSALVYTERQRQYVTGFGIGSYTPQAVVNGRYDLMDSRTVELVITESGLALQVGLSEKSGRLPRYTSVVRHLSVLGKVGADGTFVATLELKLNPDWKLPALRAVALVQEISSRRIVGAVIAPLTNYRDF